jgi:hypothetical protein
MTHNPRALAVIRRIDALPNGYEAWLQHNNAISSQGFGIRQTKNMLQYKANLSLEFPDHAITAADIEAALTTEGAEVMVYFLTKGDPVRMPSQPSAYDDEYISTVQVQTPGYISQRTLPPLTPPPPLTPFLDPVIGISEKLDCLAVLDDAFAGILADVMIPQVKGQGGALPEIKVAESWVKLPSYGNKKIAGDKEMKLRFRTSCEDILRDMIFKNTKVKGFDEK